MTLITAVLLLLVAQQIVPIASRLIGRVRATRECMVEAERGNLLVRAEARHTDELGFLQRSFNRMLDEIGQIIGAVQREADEVAAFAEGLARSAAELHAAATELTSTAGALAGELVRQRGFTETGSRQTSEAAA